MLPTENGSIRLFKLAGITVFLHWSWFLIAAIQIGYRGELYSTLFWNVAEYIALFCIVLAHEFGHSLACRSVGGRADKIILWPLGGVAYVDPPRRPGATLWSVAAGPLVNVILFPISIGVYLISRRMGWEFTHPNLAVFVENMCYMNFILLVFNLIPIYPLDGGQIFSSILWFFMGQSRSLMVATVMGFVGVGGLAIFALWTESLWYFIIAMFVMSICWSGFQYARMLRRVELMPQRVGFACPSCKMAPPDGARWRCGGCGQVFDPFAMNGQCPGCGTRFEQTRCPNCGVSSPLIAWVLPTEPPPISRKP
jgi:Zn-dependent protease/rubredoxin